MKTKEKGKNQAQQQTEKLRETDSANETQAVASAKMVVQRHSCEEHKNGCINYTQIRFESNSSNFMFISVSRSFHPLNCNKTLTS